MNHRSEIHRGCKQEPKFHRFGTDDHVMGEKVNLTNGTDHLLDPVDRALACYLDIIDYSHMLMSEHISSKPDAAHQLHHWFMGQATKRRAHLLFFEDCNVTL
eukprot:5774802-Ditylum_brightwellii.AAC.1